MIKPILCNAHFTGIGLDSIKRLSCNKSNLVFIRLASLSFPCEDSKHISCIAFGATFAVTDMFPLKPSSISLIEVLSSPVNIDKFSEHLSNNSLDLLISPDASLMPIIFG